ncbi:endolytic transglycosylase MltG [Candidatus Zixiibacteriota bacterium]
MIKRLVLIFLVVIILAAASAAYLVFGKIEIPQRATTQVIVKKGASTAEIAADLDRQGLVRSKMVFLWLARLWGVDRRLKPGRYDFAGHVSTYDILQDLHDQNALIIRVTFPEGWQIDRFGEWVERKLGTLAEQFVQLCRDSVFLSRWDIPTATAEGYLMPTTYRFYWGVEPEEIIGELITATQRLFTDSLVARMGDLGWSKHETLTMASLIEAEAGVAVERTRISAVFHNRLQQRIKLQCDPTVIYAMGGINRRLLYKDLEINSPYNTYLHYGLPPGPINNPGEPAVLAALYPDESDELYFVARGDGTHIFSRTLAEHNRARRLVRRLQREGGG